MAHGRATPWRLLTGRDRPSYNALMPGVSVVKILLILVGIGVVWLMARMLSRVRARHRDAVQLRMEALMRRAMTGGVGDDRAKPGTGDLVQCSVCSYYVPANETRSCGRSGCPHGGE